MNKFLELAEKGFIILGLSFFSGVFGITSMGMILPAAFVTLIRFSIWGISTFLIFIFWRNAIKTINQNKFLFILTVLAFLSFLWSTDPEYTLSNARDVWMMTTFGLYFAIRFSLKEQVKIIALTIFIGMFLSIFFVFLVPAIGKHGIDHVGAWRGVYGHKNYFGSMMILSSLAFLLLPKDTSAVYKWIGFSFSIALMLFSTSKTSLVISLLLILIIFFYKNFRWQGKASVIFIDILVLVLGCISLLVFSYWVELITGLGRDPTLTGRTFIWQVALNRLMERPLLGYGRGAFWAPKSKYAIEAGQVSGTGWAPPHGHNGLIDMALDVGLIGLSLFLITYLNTFFQALKLGYATKKAEETWPLAYLIFLAMNNVTESYLLYLPNVYWVLFITVVCTINNKGAFSRT